MHVHYPKLGEKESEGGLSELNFDAMNYGIGEWEKAVPGVNFIKKADYKIKTIKSEVEKIAETVVKHVYHILVVSKLPDDEDHSESYTLGNIHGEG